MSPIQPTAAHDALVSKLDREQLPSGCKSIENCVVKNGPRAFKSASLLLFGNPDTEEITKRELRVQSWTSSPAGSRIDFTRTDNAWHCEDAEIETLRAFLNGQLPEPGRYRRIGSGSVNQVIDAIEAGSLDAGDLEAVVSALVHSPGLVGDLARSDPAERLASAVRSARHSKTLDNLEALLDQASVTERRLQEVLEEDWWIFGGRFMERSNRRSLTVLDQIDVPLIRSDGVLHIVELKGARIPQVVVRHRNHVIVGSEVNEAVGQVMNYLRSLDEQRDSILNTLGVDCRRAFATVVIGDPRWVTDLDEAAVNETIRTYNSHLTRIEVITYGDLLRDSRNAVALQNAMD